MCRKLFWTALIVGGIAWGVTHTKAGRYVTTMVDRGIERLEESIPLEVDLAALKRDLRKLGKEEEKIEGRYATVKVDAERLAPRVKQTQEELASAEEQLHQKGEELKKVDNKNRVSWNGRSISVQEGKNRLFAEVETLKARKNRLAVDEKRLAHLTQDRDALDQQRKAYREQVAKLEQEVALLETEINLLKTQRIKSKHQNDDSVLGEAKTNAEKLARRIAIEREKVALASERYETKNNAVTNQSVEEILKGLNPETPDEN
jgi:chromosome segregation ATPase